VHRSKAEHKHAIFILGKEIASVMTLDEFSGPGRTQVRMQELASRAVDEMSIKNVFFFIFRSISKHFEGIY